MSSRQALRDLNTYWETINATRKKCKKSGKTINSPDSLNRVECIVNTLNSIAKNNTPNSSYMYYKQYRTHVVPLTGKKRSNALAAAANNQNNNSEGNNENENNNNSENNNNENENNHSPSSAASASASASASAPLPAAPLPAAPLPAAPLPAAPLRASAAPLRASRPSRAATAAAANAAALKKFRNENPPKKINDIFNGNTVKTVSDLIIEKCFNNNTSEFTNANITLNPMPTGSTNKPIYTILFNNNKIHNGNTYILKQDNTTFSIQEISATRQVKGGRRRKTQKKNKHKKRTTSKRR